MKPRLFEFLAATNEMGSTPVPGDRSFTSALIYGLEALVKKKNGRFTTDELLRKIQHEAPNFPKEQTPVLSDREEGNTSAGRIMLHPLDRNGTSAQSPSKEGPGLDPTKRQILTLHFDYSERPSNASIEMLGLQLNHIFDRNNTLGVTRVRFGGLRSSVFHRAAKSFTESLVRHRRTSGRQQRPPVNTLLPVPPHQQFSSALLSAAPRDEGINIQDSIVIVAPVSPLSNEDSEDQMSDHCKKRKLLS